jgi:hypothetical protein
VLSNDFFLQALGIRMAFKIYFAVNKLFSCHGAKKAPSQEKALKVGDIQLILFPQRDQRWLSPSYFFQFLFGDPMM